MVVINASNIENNLRNIELQIKFEKEDLFYVDSNWACVYWDDTSTFHWFHSLFFKQYKLYRFEK